MSARQFLDSSVLLLAVGAEHPRRDPCRELLERAAVAAVQMHVSTEAIQEFLFHRMRMSDRASALAQTRRVLDLCVVHDFDTVVLRRTLDLVATTQLRGRDAVHAATALVQGFATIVTSDADFAEVPGLRCVRPEDVR